MLCLCSTGLPLIYARKTSLKSVSYAVLRKLNLRIKMCVVGLTKSKRGYSLYGQAIVGQTPCYTAVPTAISVPQTVLASISSSVAAKPSVKSTTAVSVIINQVFALSLPCADIYDDNDLSTGAKAGVGVGAGVGGLILLGLALWFCLLARKRRQKKIAEAPVASSTIGPYVPSQMYDNRQYPALPPGSPQPGYAVPPGPSIPHQSVAPHTSWSSPTHTTQGNTSVSSDESRQHGGPSPGLQPGYMPAYQVQARSYMHELPAT